MARCTLVCTVFLALVSAVPRCAWAQSIAATPPMGWNSWDSYGLAVDAEQFKANALVLASLREYGWQYAIIDEGWYMANPSGQTLDQRQYQWNENGLLIPDTSRYPSANDGAGFKPLADWVHAQGLKFGIHIVRGIPRQVATANLPIAGTHFHAADAADTSSPCPWDEGNWGIKDNAAGQAYYDSMLRLYAAWGVDFVKVDCIADHPYRPTEIRQIAEAIRKSGRFIVLSLSPGPTSIDHAAEVAKYAQMWRIANDHWDAWEFQKHTPDGFPTGIRDMFDRLALWQTWARPGTWPDADMLPEGWLGPNPGWGPVRQSRLTQDEQRTEFTLWSIARSPLILGGNLTRLDDFTRSLITNREVLSINQSAVSIDTARATSTAGQSQLYRAWYVRTGGPNPKTYLAVFNLQDHPARWTLPVPRGPAYDVWNRKQIPNAHLYVVKLGAHGCALFRMP